MKTARFYARIVLLSALGCLIGLAMLDHVRSQEEETGTPLVYVLEADGTINPALADHIVKTIDKAEEANAAALLIQLDTPGGVLTTTKTIIKEMINADIPVIVYVAPSGSSATSAGALITFCADVAAMAPGTNIGAAHPVGGGGKEIDETMSEKILNDLTAYIRGIMKRKGRNAEWAENTIRKSVSATAQEALELNAIDIIAPTVSDLLNKIDGREIKKEAKILVLNTKDARLKTVETGWRFKILDAVANPNIAYILMMIALTGIGVELYNPGMIFPGVIGIICLLLALFASQVLPINYTGIMLILLSLVLFILEVKVTSFGLLSIAAIISLTLGSVMLFDTGEQAMRVSWSVLIPTVATVSAFFVLAMTLAARAYMTKPRTGDDGLLGEVGTAMTPVDEQGRVDIHGEYWTARSDEPIPKGRKVRVVGVNNLYIQVKPFEEG